MLALVLKPTWDCTTCSENMQKTRGCVDKPAIPMIIDNEELDRCPRRPLLDDSDFFIQFFDIYYWYSRMSQFPDSGVWTSQANALVEAIRAMDRATTRAQAYKK